jgi:hypothetical protein
MADGVELVAMRLKDMHRVHPRQDNSHVCGKCGAPVGIYPSGQRALKANPGAGIVCVPCAYLVPLGVGDAVQPAGSFEEIRRESRESRDAERG